MSLGVSGVSLLSYRVKDGDDDSCPVCAEPFKIGETGVLGHHRIMANGERATQDELIHLIHETCFKTFVKTILSNPERCICSLCRVPITDVNGKKDLFYNLCLAAEKGLLEEIKREVPDPSEIENTVLFKALSQAAYRGHLGVVEYLLSKSETISEEDRGNLVISAARQCHLSVVKYLLPEGAQIPEGLRYWAVYVAAEEACWPLVKYLLPEGAQISEDARGWAVYFAVLFGDVDEVDYLLSVGVETLEEGRGRAVCFAAEQGHWDALQHLLSGGAKISEAARQEAISRSKKRGFLNKVVVTYLLSKGISVFIPRIEVALVVGIAALIFASRNANLFSNAVE